MENFDFEQLSVKFKEKNIVKFAKKCAKSCALSKSKDAENLCVLAYWLSIYGYTEEVESIYHFVDIEIPEKVNFNIWTWILSIWGLQAYIYELGGEDYKKDKIVENMKKIYSVPRRDGQTEEEAFEFHQRIANRQTYEGICNKTEIGRCMAENDKKIELSYRFTALFSMISYGVTGEYPALSENRERLKEDIKEYVEMLKK